jgi:hypothetical protein
MTSVSAKSGFKGLKEGITLALAPMPMLELAWMGFELISQTLDMHLGSYDTNTPTIGLWRDIRNEHLELVKDDIISNGLKWPIVIGPLDKYTADQKRQIYLEEYEKLQKDSATLISWANGILDINYQYQSRVSDAELTTRQEEFTKQVLSAVKLPFKDGGWYLGRKVSNSTICAAVAMAMVSHFATRPETEVDIFVG